MINNELKKQHSNRMGAQDEKLSHNTHVMPLADWFEGVWTIIVLCNDVFCNKLLSFLCARYCNSREKRRCIHSNTRVLAIRSDVVTAKTTSNQRYRKVSQAQHIQHRWPQRLQNPEHPPVPPHGAQRGDPRQRSGNGRCRWFNSGKTITFELMKNCRKSVGIVIVWDDR